MEEAFERRYKKHFQPVLAPRSMYFNLPTVGLYVKKKKKRRKKCRDFNLCVDSVLIN